MIQDRDGMLRVEIEITYPLAGLHIIITHKMHGKCGTRTINVRLRI